MSKPWSAVVSLNMFRRHNPLPETPGVYFFLDGKKAVLYIGKATVLRDRVKSYFSSDIAETRGPKIVAMLGKTQCIGWTKTDSVLESLLLESRLIKEHQPPYNTDAKDDKSYNHVVITDERFPRVLLVRGRDLTEGKFVAPVKRLFGPFPSGSGLKEAMKIVRRWFPYRDKCNPVNSQWPATNSQKPKPCFHRQIGLCPGVCTGEISERAYGRIVQNIIRLFEGKKSDIIRSLEREMKTAAKRLEFERAGDIKKTLFGLGHIQDIALVKNHSEMSADDRRFDVRIEAFDVAHLSGTSAVGVMTVLVGGTPEKSAYRKFLLRGKYAGDDLKALREILARRVRHAEWKTPDIAVMDGGMLQYAIAREVLNTSGWKSVRLIGVVKNRKHQPEKLVGDREAIAQYRRAILLANAEAHRFAIGFHRKRRNADFLK